MTVPRVTETTPVPVAVEPDTFGGAVTLVDAAVGWPAGTTAHPAPVIAAHVHG